MDVMNRFSPDLVYLATPADKQALLGLAARRNVLPAFRAVDVARFAPILSDDVLAFVMASAGVDVHHAAKIAAFCPYALDAVPATPSVAFLKDVALRLAAAGKLTASGYRPDPEIVVLLNGAAPVPDPRYRQVPRRHVDDIGSGPVRLVEAADRDRQLSAVIAELVSLFREGVRPDDVAIVNATAADLRKLSLIVRTYGFAIDDATPVRLDRLPLFSAFLDACRSISPDDALDGLRNDPRNADETAVAALDAIASILAKYPSGLSGRTDLLAYEGSIAAVRRQRQANVVRALRLDGLSGYREGHVLVLNFTDELCPSAVVDDDYLTDREKASLGIETSDERNARVRFALGRAIGSLASATLFRPLRTDGNEIRRSAVLDGIRPIAVERFEAENAARSEAEGLLAYAKERHDVKTYGVPTPSHDRLAARFEQVYRLYDPSFTALSVATRERLAGRRAVLSATSLETFNRCRFRFLCDHLLKLAPYETSPSQELGNLAHRILRDAFAGQTPVIAAAATTVNRSDARLNALAGMLASRLDLVIPRLRERAKNVVEFAHELECGYEIERRHGFVVKGTIDRVTIQDRADGRYVFVIDYKTGFPSFSRADFDKGTDIQPVFYLHLLEKSGMLPAFIPAGFYYQPVTVGRLVRSDRKDRVADALKQDGLTLAERAAVDAAGGPEALRNVRIRDDGTFYENAAVVDRAAMRAMIERIDGFIADAVDSILSGSYAIDPERRKPGGESASCEYCRNRGLCYSVDRIEEADEAAEETEAE